VIDLVLERVGEADGAAGFVLDGFPRTVPQAEALDRRLGELDRPLEATVGLEVEEAELRRRLAERAREQDRADDEDEEAIRQRLELFTSETGALLDYYQEQGLLLRVDAVGGIDEVTRRIAEALSAHTGRGGPP
jgi:adenylate kinase